MTSLDYQKRLNELEQKIANISVKKVKFDLQLMTHNSRDLLTELSKEEVEVRRLRKVTIRYSELTEQLDRALKDLDNFITFAMLQA